MTTQAPRLGQRKCPVQYDPGNTGRPVTCGGTVRPGQLMCPPHWRQLPKPLQSEVWRTWRAFSNDSSTNGDNTTWDAYAAARQAALDHFAPPPPKPDLPSQALTLNQLDNAAFVLVVATDGSTRAWWEDRAHALDCLTRVWEQIATGGGG